MTMATTTAAAVLTSVIYSHGSPARTSLVSPVSHWLISYWAIYDRLRIVANVSIDPSVFPTIWIIMPR